MTWDLHPGVTFTEPCAQVQLVKSPEFTAGKQLETAGQIFLDIVTRREMPDFITTLLSDSYLFRFS